MDIEIILDEQPIITAVLDDVVIDTGVDVTTANATVNDVLAGKTFFAENRELKEGAIPSLGEQIYTPSEETQVINSGSYLSGNQTILPMQLMDKTVTTVGTFYAVDDEKQGYKSVSVNIPQLQETTYIPSEEQQIIQAGQYLSGNQTIQAVNLSEKSITSNGEYLASNDNVSGYKKVDVNVPTPTEPYMEEIYDATGKTLISAIMYGYKTLPGYRFRYQTQLISVSLPSQITTIGTEAFFNCQKLQLTSLPNSLTYIGGSAFETCWQISLASLPTLITYIGARAFYGCRNITLSSLPESLTTLASEVFLGCTSLQLTSLPNGITKIENAALQSCEKITLTSLPISLISIGSSAFYNCKGLTSITFKGTPTTIANNAFTGCTNLLTINVPWSQGAVANAPWGATLAQINYNYVGS